jgi:5,10-methylenetetrahydromethanopterin reductase
LLQVCLQLSHQVWTAGDAGASAQRTFDLIRTADRAGFDSVWLTEDPDGWDAFAVLGAAARETERIRLGTGVTNPYLRHPNLIAASVATVDHLSNGRAFLGLGRGQPEWYRTALGMEVGSPLAALESTIDLLRQWWRPPFTAVGQPPFSVRGWERTVAPVTHPPGPPIYIAATGEKILALAGRIADGVRFNALASQEFYRDAIATVRGSALASGRDADALHFYAHPSVTITDHPERALERKKAFIAMIHTLPGMDRQLRTPGIDVDAIMSEVRRHMKTAEVLAAGGGFAELRRAGDLEAAKRAIPTELMERVAIAGSAGHVRRQLGGLQQIGITHVFLDIDRLIDRDRDLKSLLDEIIPV